MKTLLLSLVVATSAMAESAPQCYQKTITVCPTRKPKPKPKPAAKPPVTVETVTVVVEVPAQPTEPARPAPLPAPAVKEAPKDPFAILSVHLALGGGVMGPYVSGLLGLRLKVPSWRSGLELYGAFDYGWAAQYMFYFYQGPRLSAHANLGVLGAGSAWLSTTDVPRTWDVTTGAGLEYRLLGALSFTADLRTSLVNPVFVANNSKPVLDANGNQVFGQAGRYLDVGHVLGNSLGATQLMLGFLLQF